MRAEKLPMIVPLHDDVIKWKLFRVTGHLRGEFTGPRWILRKKASDVWLNGCVNNREAGDLRRYCAHYDVIVMICRDMYGCQATIKHSKGFAFEHVHTVMQDPVNYLIIVSMSPGMHVWNDLGHGCMSFINTISIMPIIRFKEARYKTNFHTV